MHPDLVCLAARQGRAFTRGQANAFHDDSVFARWVRSGRVERLGPAVFALVPVPSDSRSRVHHAQLLVGRELIACGPTAAEWHGFGAPVDRVHVTSIGTRSWHGPPWLQVHQQLVRSPSSEVCGLRATSPGHTAVDLACAAAPIDRLAILDAARKAGVRPEQLEREIGLARGRRGVLDVRRLAPFSSPLPESSMESRSRQRILDHGLPMPDVQVKVLTRYGRRRLDMAYRARRIGVEYDGEDFHTGDGSLGEDRLRHNSLIELGWVILYLTARDVYRHPARFLTSLTELLRTRPVWPID